MSETINNPGINDIKKLLDEKKALYFKMLDENIEFAELKKDLYRNKTIEKATPKIFNWRSVTVIVPDSICRCNQHKNIAAY